jgi:ribonuclease Z
MKTRTIALSAAAVIAVGLLLAGPGTKLALRMPAVQQALIRRGFAQAMQANAAAEALVDAPVLRVVLCGTGSPIPSPERAGPCAAVLAGGKIWLVDVGGGGWKNMNLWHMPGDKLAAVLLTHFHSDHIEDLGEVNLVSWVAGRTQALPVYGGPGVDSVVAGFTAAYVLDTGYRERHHGPTVLAPAAAQMVPHVVEAGLGVVLHEGQVQTVLEADGMKISAIGVNHSPVSPAYAYRFDYGGRSVVISGDTRASPDFATAIAGVDVLVHEAQADDALGQIHDLMAQQGNARMAKVLNDIQSYHTTPAQAGEIANKAGAKLLVLTHLTPALPAMLAVPVFMQDVQATRPSGTVLGYDGLMVSLPSGSAEITVSNVPYRHD